MNKMIYTMGYIADNGDVILKGAYRSGDTDNQVFVTIGKDRITADVIQTEAGAVRLSSDMIMDICDSHECGSCPLDYYGEPYDSEDNDE